MTTSSSISRNNAASTHTNQLLSDRGDESLPVLCLRDIRKTFFLAGTYLGCIWGDLALHAKRMADKELAQERTYLDGQLYEEQPHHDPLLELG